MLKVLGPRIPIATPDVVPPLTANLHAGTPELAPLSLHHDGSSPLNALEAASAFVPAARARRHARRRPRRLVPLAPSRKQHPPRPTTTAAAAKASAWEPGPTSAAATAREGEATAGRAEEAGHRPGGERPGRRYVRHHRPGAAHVCHRGLEPRTSRSQCSRVCGSAWTGASARHGSASSQRTPLSAWRSWSWAAGSWRCS